MFFFYKETHNKFVKSSVVSLWDEIGQKILRVSNSKQMTTAPVMFSFTFETAYFCQLPTLLNTA